MSVKFGIFLRILSTLCSTMMLACVKGLHGHIPTGEVIFFRSLLALPPLIIWLRLQGPLLPQIKTRNIGGHIVRGFSGAGGMLFNYMALVYLSLADVTAISYAAPLITVILSFVLLREHVFLSRWISVFIGFCGIMLMLSGKISLGHLAGENGLSSQGMLVGAIYALIAAGCAATSNVQIRYLNGHELPGAIVFWFSMMTTVISLFTAMTWIRPDSWQLLLLIGCGLFGGTAQILITLSLRYSDASLLAPFDYTTLVWSTLVGAIFLGSLPDMTTLAGASIIALAGLFNLWGSHLKKIKNTAHPIESLKSES